MIKGFEPKKLMLKDDAVPNIFSASAKQRKLSEARASKAENCAMLDGLFSGPSNSIPSGGVKQSCENYYGTT